MKGAILLAIGILMSACSSPSIREGTGARAYRVAHVPGQEGAMSASGRSVEIAASRSGGMLRLEFDEAGNWHRIIVRGTAELPDGVEISAAALESAYTVAGLRAKQALSEFLSSDVRTTRTVRRIARSYGEVVGDAAADSSVSFLDEPRTAAGRGEEGDTRREPDRQSERLAVTLVERIAEQSSAIVRGAQFTRREQVDGGVLVELAASRESIGAATEIARRMKGQM